MNSLLGTPPRGTQSSAAAFFTSPSSPLPRRPDHTPTSVASSDLRGVSSPPPTTTAGLPRRSSRAVQSLHSSMDRYVAAPARHHASLAHFLLTSTEPKTPMLIRAAQQHHLSLRSPSRDSSSMPPTATTMADAYPSPTRYAVDRGSPIPGGEASPPRPRGSLPRAGSARLSSIFAKMHLDPSIRSSRDRSLSNASVTGEGTAAAAALLASGAGGDPSSSPTFSFASSTMELEPYTTKLARTLFSDAPQSTVLSVNDTSVRPTTVTPAAAAVASVVAAAASSRRTPATPLSPDVADPAVGFTSALGDSSATYEDHTRDGGRSVVQRGESWEQAEDEDEADDDDAVQRARYADEEAEGTVRDSGDAENARRRTVTSGGVLGALGRVPLATADVNLHGMTEGERYDAALGVVFECNRARNFTSPSFRVIPHTPERILDAADMEDDFYMNLIDWSAASDVLCVALQSCVYLWDAKTCRITALPRATTSALDEFRGGNAQLVCGLNWAPDGQHLAVGRNSGVVEVWDVETRQIVHSYRQHTDRTVSLAWEPLGGSLLASGSRDSTIVLRDVRQRDASSLYAPFTTTVSSVHDSAVSILQGHETEVCGLKWSPNGTMLASGGNDNQLLLWDRRSLVTGNGGGSISSASSNSNGRPISPYAAAAHSPQPLFYLNKHTAAVKALSWNPMQPALLASGGGSHDKSLRFWNTLTGECIHHVNTGSQVCGVVWNRTGTELVTAHGYTDNQLSIWRYPSLRRIASLIGHTSRVLHLALSADGETVVSAAGDETLRFWRCFPASELRESSPHLYRSFYSPFNASSLSGSSYVGGGVGGGSPGGVSSAIRARAAVAAGRCGSASQDRDMLSFMDDEVELR